MSHRAHLFLFALFLAASSSLAAQETAPPPATDTQALLDHLERTRARFLDSIAGLSEEQWRWKPAPERWSVAECAEHITRTEAFLRGFTVEMLATAPSPELLAKARGKSATVLAMIVDRSQRFQAPEPINPAKQGDVRSRAAIERDFNFERGRTYQVVAEVGEPETHAGMHAAFAELDLAGYVYFLSGHVERHTLQIDEVKASVGFPGS
jgi:hypothetical protein